MFLTLRADKDAYITNRVINGVSQVNANVGGAGSLDLFKLYGLTSSGSVPNVELSRLLVHFDLSPLASLVSTGKVDITNPSFTCRLRLFDVYGGQPTPRNFNVLVNPLSSSFDEGLGRDVVLYGDNDVCNWTSGSLAGGAWIVSGCGQGNDKLAAYDYFGSEVSSQFFITGEEDLDVDVTEWVTSVLVANDDDSLPPQPDAGFRVSFDPALEADQNTYFVKRFASRTAFNTDMHPVMHVTFDDSIQDDTDNVFMDSPSTLFMYNYVQSRLTNLVSGTHAITGSNCMFLALSTPVSGGLYGLVFNASQHFAGANPVTGIYSASITIPSSDQQLQEQLQASGSITFTPTWTSRDGTVTYLTGEPFKAHPPTRGGHSMAPKKFNVTVLGLPDSVGVNEQTVVRVNIFDYTKSYVSNTSRLPVDLPGIVVRDVHYQVRDQVTNRIVIPFDTLHNSTRVSNDVDGMYFTLDTSNLTCAHTYVIDVLITTTGNQQLYKSASPAFRVASTP